MTELSMRFHDLVFDSHMCGHSQVVNVFGMLFSGVVSSPL